MTQTILITGSTDGIGLETARRLAAEGRHAILHGRDPAKLDAAEAQLRSVGAASPRPTPMHSTQKRNEVVARHIETILGELT